MDLSRLLALSLPAAPLLVAPPRSADRNLRGGKVITVEPTIVDGKIAYRRPGS